jgi:beta/gamma crystallin
LQEVAMSASKIPAIVIGMLALATLAAAAPQVGQMGGVGITVFEDANFRGENATFRDDQPDLRRARMESRISSLQVAPGELWEVCEQPNYGGRCQVFSGSEPDLSRRSWNDRISSLRRVRGGGGMPPQPGQGGLVLFSDEFYRGQARAFEIATPSLGSFNDRAQSARVYWGQWELCDDSGYRNCRVVDRDWPNLASIGLSEKVSSVRPLGGGGIAVPRPPVVRPRLVLYDRARYRGASRALDNASGGLGGFGNRAQSAQVIGTWELCDGASFSGRCVTVSQNVPNLGSLGMNNRVSSARPR